MWIQPAGWDQVVGKWRIIKRKGCRPRVPDFKEGRRKAASGRFEEGDAHWPPVCEARKWTTTEEVQGPDWDAPDD